MQMAIGLSLRPMHRGQLRKYFVTGFSLSEWKFIFSILQIRLEANIVCARTQYDRCLLGHSGWNGNRQLSYSTFWLRTAHIGWRL